MNEPDAIDAIDAFVGGWRTARPDLDFGSMALFARLNHFVRLGMKSLDAALEAHGLSLAEFDVLSALRRSGEPFVLRPSQLADALMVSRSGVTAKIDKLADRGLVERQRDLDDRRSEPVVLTAAGKALIDAAIVTHLGAGKTLFERLSKSERRTLEAALRRISDPNPRS